MEIGHRRRRLGVGAAVLGAVGILAWLTLGPSTSRQGIDQQRIERTVPRYVKAREFLRRHRAYASLARGVTRTAPSEPERAVALFAWTRENIRAAPREWPVIDDHVLSVLERGYGVPYQQADVLATLLTYAGLPAFFQRAQPAGGEFVPLVFVLIDGKWAVLDVANDTVFRDARGDLREAHDVVRSVSLPPARPLRAELQMPWPRLLHEARRALGR